MITWEEYDPDNDPQADWYAWDLSGAVDAEMWRYQVAGLVGADD